VPAGNHGNLAARRLHLGQQRRLLLRRPLPATLGPRNNLAVHSTGLLLYVQKDPVSPGALPLATPVRPVQTGRLRMTRREISKKFDEIVAFSEVENFLDTPVKWYSSACTSDLLSLWPLIWNRTSSGVRAAANRNDGYTLSGKFDKTPGVEKDRTSREPKVPELGMLGS